MQTCATEAHTNHHEPKKLLCSIPEAYTALNIGPSYFYELLAADKIKSVKFGKRRLIPYAEVERLSLEGATAPAKPRNSKKAHAAIEDV